jgi:hypothetical protein
MKGVHGMGSLKREGQAGKGRSGLGAEPGNSHMTGLKNEADCGLPQTVGREAHNFEDICKVNLLTNFI